MPWRFELFPEDLVGQELTALGPEHRARLAHIRNLVNEFGVALGHPHSDSFGDGLHEFRLKGPDTTARILFVTRPGKRIVMLRCFIKKTQKTPASEIALARQRAAHLGQVESSGGGEQKGKAKQNGR